MPTDGLWSTSVPFVKASRMPTDDIWSTKVPFHSNTSRVLPESPWSANVPYTQSYADMFGGYTEVAAYYVNTPWPEADDEGGECGPGGLPPDYSPHFAPADPWHLNAACQQDFVMIAEFSEQEGPKPLIVIPKEGGGQFDLNEFSVRIMSVDFQTIAGSSFTTTEDTQLIMSETHNGMYAYVHHFTLYDYQARGFVRPFCMSYVTPDQNKLWSMFEKMSEQLKQVAQCFKHGNLCLFVKDMMHYLSDLHYTKGKFLEREDILNSMTEHDRNSRTHILDDPEEDTAVSQVTLAAILNLITEVKGILESTSTMLTEMGDRDIEADLKPSSKTSPHQGEPPEDPLNTDAFRYSCSLHSSSSSRYMESARPRAGSAPLSQCTWTEDKDMYTPTVVRTTNKKRFDKALRSLHELCMWGAKAGINLLRDLHKYFSREMYAIQSEQSDVSCDIPHWGLMSVGRTVQLNFLSGLDMFKSSTPNGSEGGSEKKSCDSDAMLSFHSADSFLSCEGDNSPARGQQGPIEDFSSVLPSTCDETCGENVLNTTSTDSGVGICSPGSLSAVDVEIWSYGSNASTSGSCSSRTGSMGGISSRSDSSRLFRPYVSPDVSTSVSVVSSAEHITNFNQLSPGYGIQKLMQQSPSLCHVAFSILCGRPTVVFGSFRIEKDIRMTVNALSLFVPGHSNSAAVHPWHTTPLCIKDLCYHKLIGLSRPEKRKLEHMIPSAVKGYVTIYDIEKKMIWSPEYQFGVLTDIYNKSKVLEEQTLITYIHSVFYELSLKGHLFFHKFCLGCEGSAIPQNHSSDCFQSPARKHLHKKSKVEIFNELKVTKPDAKIIEYFSDIVATQHLTECIQYNPEESGSALNTVQLGYTKCSWYKA